MFACKLNEKTVLRMLEHRHAEELFAVVDANREHLRPWLPWVDNTISVSDSREFIRNCLRKFAENGEIVAGIWYEGKLAGIASLEDIDTFLSSAEIGYWLAEQYQGKGLVTTACRALLNHGFENLKLNRIQIRVESNNVRSRAVPERLGFTHEGTLRQGIRIGDRRPDLEVYSLLFEEWKP